MNQLLNLGTGKKPSKKLFAILATAFLSVLGVVGYISFSGDSNDAPPYLSIDTSSLMQGKLNKRDGFAKLPSTYGYACSGEERILEGNVNNVFSTKPITFKEVADSLKFDKKDGQYLIAFFSNGDEKAGQGFNEEGWYFYPTSNSPYDTGDYKEFNIESSKGGDYTIPAYRGFQIVVNNTETKVCGKDVKLSTDKDVLNGMDDSNIVQFYKDGLKYWPEGWVMIPLGVDFANGLAEFKNENPDGVSFGLEIDSVYLQTDRATFVKDFDDNTKSDYLMIWVKVGKAFDWAAFVDKANNPHCVVNDPNYPEINGDYPVGESYTDPENDDITYICVADLSSETGGKFIIYNVEEDPADPEDPAVEPVSCAESNFENGILTVSCNVRVKHNSSREKAELIFTINNSSEVRVSPQIDNSNLTMIFNPATTGYGTYVFKDVVNLVDEGGQPVTKDLFKITDFTFDQPEEEVFCTDNDGVQRAVGYSFTYTKGDSSWKETCLPNGEWQIIILGSPIALIGDEVNAEIEDVYAFPIVAAEKYGMEADKYLDHSLVAIQFNYSNDLLRSFAGYYQIKGKDAFYDSLILSFGDYNLHPVDTEFCPGGLTQCSDSFLFIFAFSNSDLSNDFILDYENAVLKVNNLKMQDDTGSLYNVNGEYIVEFKDLDYVPSSPIGPLPISVTGYEPNRYANNDDAFYLIFDGDIDNAISKDDIKVSRGKAFNDRNSPVEVEFASVYEGNKLSIGLAEDPSESFYYKVEFLPSFKSADGGGVTSPYYEFYFEADLEATSAWMEKQYDDKDRDVFIYVGFNKPVYNYISVPYNEIPNDFSVSPLGAEYAGVTACTSLGDTNPCIFQYFSVGDVAQPYYPQKTKDNLGRAIRVGLKNIDYKGFIQQVTVTKEMQDENGNLIDPLKVTVPIEE